MVQFVSALNTGGTYVNKSGRRIKKFQADTGGARESVEGAKTNEGELIKKVCRVCRLVIKKEKEKLFKLYSLINCAEQAKQGLVSFS